MSGAFDNSLKEQAFRHGLRLERNHCGWVARLAGRATRSELLAGGGVLDHPPDQPASAEGKPREHVLAATATNLGVGRRLIVCCHLRYTPHLHREPLSVLHSLRPTGSHSPWCQGKRRRLRHLRKRLRRCPGSRLNRGRHRLHGNRTVSLSQESDPACSTLDLRGWARLLMRWRHPCDGGRP